MKPYFRIVAESHAGCSRNVILNIMTSVIPYVLIFFVIVVMSCKVSNNELRANLKSNKTFNQSETIQLLGLLKEFDRQICEIEKIDSTEILNCYTSFFRRIEIDAIENGKLRIGINQENQSKIIEQLDITLRKEIWIEGRAFLNRRIKYTNPSLSIPDSINENYLNFGGRYFTFLSNELAQDYDKIQTLVERIRAIGDISPSVIADIFKNYKEYNIKDDRVRLLIAIHYLTLNDSSLKMTESYNEIYDDIKYEFRKRRKKTEHNPQRTSPDSGHH